jgi:hypothetical protein
MKKNTLCAAAVAVGERNGEERKKYKSQNNETLNKA